MSVYSDGEERVLSRAEWAELDLRRLREPHAWPTNPLPVKRDPPRPGLLARLLGKPPEPTTGILYDHDTAVYEHAPPHRLIRRYGSIEALARDWRPD